MTGLLARAPAWVWLSIVLGLWTVVEEARLASLRGDLAREREAHSKTAGLLGACRTTRTSLLEQTIDQNRAVASLRQAATDRAAVARAGQASARSAAEQDYQAANRLQQERTGGDACAAAEAVIDQELGL